LLNLKARAAAPQAPACAGFLLSTWRAAGATAYRHASGDREERLEADELGVCAAVIRDLVELGVLRLRDEFLRLAHDAAAIGRTLGAPRGVNLGIFLAGFDAAAGKRAALLAIPVGGDGQGNGEKGGGKQERA